MANPVGLSPPQSPENTLLSVHRLLGRLYNRKIFPNLHTADLYSTSDVEGKEVMKNTKGTSVTLELLEGRTMMSAAPSHPALMVDATVKATTTVKATAKVTKAAVTAVAISADPTVTDPSIKYENFASDPLFSSAGPTPADVNQGYVGDCYFLSTLSSVAKLDPSLIRKDVIANGDGTFTVDFTNGKTQNQIRVNADLP